MFKGKGWFGGSMWKPKNPHSLEHLKYLYNILSKNQTVSEQNKSLLVETLRLIAEILIWGDQNDSTVFDFFLEKNMLSFFLKIMKQKCGRYVCVQLLQTLNILFENIRNETSLYYLLSNNHVNYIIVHKFDFSDEEVMAYYISFLKTLSLKLNTHTIHFFYNEHTHDFPLYTEAIKFFNHSESMVRIAVRTLTLNVYKVDDKSMLQFIRDKTAAPYFSNLVWFIGNHVLELDACVRNDADHQSKNRLADLVAEHLDHLHYLNDILCLQIDALNEVLTDHLLNRLLIPLYVYSLVKRRRSSKVDVEAGQDQTDKPLVSCIVSLFLLSQVFLIISHVPLVRQLADIILNCDASVFNEGYHERPQSLQRGSSSRPRFIAPPETLEKLLESEIRTSRRLARRQKRQEMNEAASPSTPASDDSNYSLDQSAVEPSISPIAESHSNHDPQPEVSTDLTPAIESASEVEPVTNAEDADANLNITDEEKQKLLAADASSRLSIEQLQEMFSLANRPYLDAVFNSLDFFEDDYATLFALCLLYALGHNLGLNQELLDAVLIPTDKSETKHWYNVNLVERLIRIISSSCQYNSKVRLATLELSILLLRQLVVKNGRSFLQDRHLAALEGAREESTLLLRNFYKSEEIFLDMFEDEYREMKKKPLNVEYLTMDSSILLPPTGTPLTGIEFAKRLPCGEVERARRAIRVFFMLRELSLMLRMEPEIQLPLTNPQACIQVGTVLDLNNSDLIACTVLMKDCQKIRRFLVIDVLQLILVEPDTRRLGWGLAKFVGFLQDIEVTGDKDDSRCLHVTIHRPLNSSTAGNRIPLLSAKFVFDDHIRCMAAKQRLSKGRMKARKKKMHMIALLLELPSSVQPCPSPPLHSLHISRHHDQVNRHSAMPRSMSHEHGMRLRSATTGSQHKPLFSVGGKVPGFAAMMRQGESRRHHSSRSESSDRQARSSTTPSPQQHRSRESSPRAQPSSSGSSEEIPLEDLSCPRSPSQRRSVPNLPVARLKTVSGVSKTQWWDTELVSESDSGEVSTASSEITPISPTLGISRRESAPKSLRPPDLPPVSLLESASLETAVTGARIVPPAPTEQQSTAEPDLVGETSFVENTSNAEEPPDESTEATASVCDGSAVSDASTESGPTSNKSQRGAIVDI